MYLCQKDAEARKGVMMTLGATALRGTAAPSGTTAPSDATPPQGTVAKSSMTTKPDAGAQSGAAASAPKPYAPKCEEPVSTINSNITKEYLDEQVQSGKIRSMSWEELGSQVFNRCVLKIGAFNAGLLNQDRAFRKRVPRGITPVQMALITRAKKIVRRVGCAGLEGDASYDVLAIYQEDGPNKGIFDPSEDQFKTIARELDPDYSKKDFEDYMAALRDLSERVEPYSEGRYIAVNNGLIDYEDPHRPKQLLPFTHNMVFLNKSRVNYIPNAKLITIHNDKDGTDWDVEAFVAGLVNSPELVELLWQILGAVIRPGGAKGAGVWSGFQKCVLLVAPEGCNGKGTYCQLARNLSGPGTTASIPMDKLGENFALEKIIGKTAIITDESNVGKFLDECANLKSLVTHDPVQINRKHRTAVTYSFRGLLIFCVNEKSLRVKDKSGSFLRRILAIPFPNSFLGQERAYIKDDYINRPEVLEYVLFKVLNMENYYTLGEPQESKALLADMALQNDPVRQFVEEILPQCRWDLLPFSFLYDLYKAYFNSTNPSGSPLGKAMFTSSLHDVLRDSPDWVWPDLVSNNGNPPQYPQYSSAQRMVGPEPLIIEYDLKKWMNPSWRGTDRIMAAEPVLKKTYRGILRRKATP